MGPSKLIGAVSVGEHCRKLWKLQLLAVKKQQAFQEAVQSIPVSEMEKMIGASHAELERATQNYEKFLLANEGKGRSGILRGSLRFSPIETWPHLQSALANGVQVFAATSMQ